MFEQIFPNMYVFYSASMSSNSYLLVGKKTILIDSGLKIDAPLLKDSLSATGLSPEDIDIVCHTHGHADHFGGDVLFPKAKIMMHKEDAEYVNVKDDILSASAALGNDYYPKIKEFLKNNQIIDLKAFKLKIIHTPGHTKGCVCFYEPNHKFLFSGDTLFAEGYGRYDFANSSKKQLTQSLKTLETLDFNTLFPGHGLMSKSPKNNLQNALSQLETPK